MEGGRRVPHWTYPDHQYLVHRMAKAYGWTEQQIDLTDADLLDWLCAIQGIEAEVEEQAVKKQQADLKRQSSTRKPRR